MCERAKIAELNARAAAHGHSGVLQPSVIPPQPVQPTLRTTIYPPNVRGEEIELKEVHGVDLDAEGEGEEEVDYDASDLEYDEDDEDEEDEEDLDDEEDGDGRRLPYDIISYSAASPPSLPQHPSAELRARPKKRSSDELLDDDDYDGLDDATATTGTGRTDTGTEDDDSTGGVSPTTTLRKSGYRSQGGTPPKRARIGEEDGKEGRPRSLSSSVGSDGEERPRYQYYAQYEEPAQLSPPTRHQSQPQSPGRHRKRNSEELDDADEDVHVPPHHQGKRVRTEEVVGSGTRSSPLLVASPDSLSTSSPSASAGLSWGDDLMREVMREVEEEDGEEGTPHLPSRGAATVRTAPDSGGGRS